MLLGKVVRTTSRPIQARRNHTRTQAQWAHATTLVEKSGFSLRLEQYPEKGAGLVAKKRFGQGEVVFFENPYVCVSQHPQLTHLYPLSLQTTHLIQEETKGTPLEQHSATLASKLEQYLNDKMQERGEDVTMSKLMIFIYIKILNQFNKGILKGETPVVALEQALTTMWNLMSFRFDPFIDAGSMPVLDKQKQDQEWILEHIAPFSGIDPKSDEYGVFDYQKFIALFVKTNLNYFNDDTQQTQEEKELGVYPMGALMNHSCKPNVNMLPENETTYWVATRDIEEGEEVTIHYVDPRIPFKERQEFLLAHHYFRCPCSQDCTA